MDIPDNASASGILGVTTLANGSKRLFSARTPAGLSNAAPLEDANTGSTTIAHDDVWVFLDGQNATQFSSVYNPPQTDLWFSGETLFLDWYNTGLPGDERMTLSVGSTTVGHGLW